MAIPCPEPKPHRSHFADNADGICGGVPRRADRARAVLMVGEAFRRAEKACKHRFGDDPDWAAVGSCRPCLAAALLDLAVFEPVLFPEETK